VLTGLDRLLIKNGPSIAATSNVFARWRHCRANRDVSCAFLFLFTSQCFNIYGVRIGVSDFPAEGDLVVTMFAGDCDILEKNRQVTYSLRDIQFEFLDPDLGYSLDQESKDRLRDAFTISPSGAVTPRLMSYRPYSFGRFILTVVATDTKGRSDTSELKVCFQVNSQSGRRLLKCKGS